MLDKQTLEELDAKKIEVEPGIRAMPKAASIKSWMYEPGIKVYREKGFDNSLKCGKDLDRDGEYIKKIQ